MKSAIAIRHIHFEDLGVFEPALKEKGYRVTYVDVGENRLSTVEPLDPDVLIVLGAPVGVYETGAYPFLAVEQTLLSERLRANLPTLGICLGAQQIAATLGADVRAGGYKEIGFAPVELTQAGRNSPLRYLEGVPVLHWHGDTFEIPAGAIRLAATELCANQAFSLGNTLGLQFHPEIDVSKGLEAWLIGHAAELAASKISPQSIRHQTAQFGSSLRNAACRMFSEWLQNLKT